MASALGARTKRNLSIQLNTWHGTLLAEPFLLARFSRSRERLCMNRVRSLLSMRFMLPGYSLEPKPNMLDFAAILVFLRSCGLNYNDRFVTKRMLALEKPV